MAAHYPPSHPPPHGMHAGAPPEPTLGERPPPPTVLSHFGAMLRKNFLQQWRRPVGAIFEAVLPLGLVLLLVIVWKVSSFTEVPAKQFAQPQEAPSVTDAIVSTVCASAGSPAAASLPLCNTSFPVQCGSKYVPVEGLCVYPERHHAVLARLTFMKPGPIAVPSFDALQLMRWALWTVAKDDVTEVDDMPEEAAPFFCPGPLHFAPDTAATRALIAHLNTTTSTMRYTSPRVWPSVGAAEDWYKDRAFRWPEDCPAVLIEVRSLSARSTDIVLHFNRSAVPSTAEKEDRFAAGIPNYYGKAYVLSGFASMQLLLAEYVRSALGVTAPVPLPDGSLPVPAPVSLTAPFIAAPMPFAQYDDSQFLNSIGGLAPLFIVFGYLFPVSQLTKRLVVEKETRTREAMHIMGLSYGPFLLSWLVTYVVPALVSSAVITLTLALTMLDGTSWVLIFLLFFLFGTSTVALSTLLAAFFSKSRMAAVVAPVAFFVMAIPSFALPERTPSVAHVFLSILSPSAFAEGTKLLFNLERTTGAGLPELFDANPGSYPLAVSVLMLLVDTLLYIALGVYVDAVMPSDWGVPKHPLFFLRFRCCPWSAVWGEAADDEGAEPETREPQHHHGGAFEMVDRSGRAPSVEMRAMRRVFSTDNGRMVAVDNLSHALYEGEVSVLLGHNGAGKTTAINMMTGMLDMTSGDCILAGHSVRQNLAAVRQEIGMCPQHNILWEELTCKEHLEFFAGLKGIRGGNEREAEAVRMLRAVDLFDKADVPAGGLSGGMKRKLSVAIAFVGGPKVVFLDEPTAGMDVAARRFTWDLIKRMTPGHTIVLTTHFMDEADLLGNTIAIMSKGRLQCAGSPMFLKNRLGVGYTLAVACDPTRTGLAAPIVDLVQSHVRDAAVLSEHASELTVQLPMAGVPQFPALLEALETRASALGIRGHGLSVTTLEEVFLRLGREGTADSAAPATVVETRTAKNDMSDPTTPLVKAAVPVSQAMETATALMAEDQVRKERYARMFARKQANVGAPLHRQLWPLLVKRFHNAKRDHRAQVMQVLLPAVCLLLAMLLTLIKFDNEPGIAMLPNVYKGGTEIPVANCPAAFATSALPDALVVNATTAATSPVPAAEPTPQQMSAHLLATAKAHGRKRLASVVCNPTNITVESNAVAAYVLNNETAWPHALPLAVQEYAVMSLRTLATDPALEFNIASQPLPLTRDEKVVVGQIQAFMIGIFVMIPFTFIPATFVAWVVKEREHKTKHLQTVSGMHYTMYWASNFLFDFCSFLVTAALALIIFASFNRKEYVGSASKFFCTFTLLLLYGVSAIAGSYLVSPLFRDHSMAQNLALLINFMAGFILVFGVFILTLIPATRNVGKVLRYVFRAWPAFCLGDGIISLASGGLMSGIASGKFETSPWALQNAGWDLIFMAIEAPLFMALTLLIDHPSLFPRFGAAVLKRVSNWPIFGGGGEATADELMDMAPEDADVRAERLLVERQQLRAGASEPDVISVRRLRKHYGSKRAVKGISFGVARGEVFAFLGTNGAGKTTSMSVLCGELLPSGGTATVCGADVVEEGGEVRRHIGYCPQFDAVLELLTVEEHLYLYAGLRGLRGEDAEQAVDDLILCCELADHLGKPARALSGGNRRKLSVAIAMMGAPDVIILDEPSAGMDPMARRGLWTVIDEAAKHCSVVLTTHHLEEVEALATRVAIMDQGEMKCIGSLQHLKSKFGSGFEMHVRVAHDDAPPLPQMQGQQQLQQPVQADNTHRVAAATAFVLNTVPHATVSEERNGKITFALPQTTRLSSVFAAMEAHKVQLHVTDYSLSQTSLESVFLRVAEGDETDL